MLTNLIYQRVCKLMNKGACLNNHLECSINVCLPPEETHPPTLKNFSCSTTGHQDHQATVRATFGQVDSTRVRFEEHPEGTDRPRLPLLEGHAVLLEDASEERLHL